MSEQENKAVVERFIHEFYHKGNMDSFDELLAPNAFVAGVSAEIQGDVPKMKEVAAQVYGAIHTMAPDVEFSIDEIVAEGNAVVARLTERGTMNGPYVVGPTRIEPTGKPFEVTGIEVYHVVDGKITERWAVRDRLGFLQQIGAPIQIG